MFKKLKIEIFYLRQMILRYGFSPRYYLKYFKNKFLGAYFLKNLSKFESNKLDNFELHVLSQKSGLWMLAWALRSFLYHSGLSPKIIIHSDGTIDAQTARMFESKFSNLQVILKEDGDRIINERKDIPDTIKKYRMAKPFPIMELTDIYLLSNSDNVMLLDSDILFYKRPDEIIDFIQDKTNYDAIATCFSKGSDLNVNAEYANKYNLIEKGARKLISGIIVYKKEKLPLERFIEYFENTLDPANPFIEQAGWASLICQTNFKYLDEERYPVRGMPDQAVCKHYTSPRRHEVYADGIDKVRNIVDKKL